MSIDSFQQRRLEEYFRRNAMPEGEARRKDNKAVGLRIRSLAERIASEIRENFRRAA